MPNKEHLRILKSGVEAWNQWRKDRPRIKPNLRNCRLIGPNLIEPTAAELNRADITPANFANVNFSDTDLSNALLTGAELVSADFTNAVLESANLSNSALFDAKFHRTNLKGASLVCSLLSDAQFRDVDLTGTSFSGALVGWSTFSNVDLSVAKGLKDVEHEGPSTVGLDTISRSRGDLPEGFLRGCGLSDWEIEARKLYDPVHTSEEIQQILDRIHHLRAHQSNSRLFISYSHQDSSFADKIGPHLNDKGVRFWRYDHHATAGPLEQQIRSAVRDYPTMLLVLSNASVKSDWVQYEVRLACKLKNETGRHVLCPVALDDSWKSCKWPERLREQIEEYTVLDFSKWRDGAIFQDMFTKLIKGIDRFYRQE